MWNSWSEHLVLEEEYSIYKYSCGLEASPAIPDQIYQLMELAGDQQRLKSFTTLPAHKIWSPFIEYSIQQQQTMYIFLRANKMYKTQAKINHIQDYKKLDKF